MAMSLSEMQLPKVNKRRDKQKEMSNELWRAIKDAIKATETKFDYKFETYEIDETLITMIQLNHQSYLREKFGPEMI
jgi:hypothetical protein